MVALGQLAALVLVLVPEPVSVQTGPALAEAGAGAQ